MGEFMCGDDWDLDAVVRGYMSQASSPTCDIMEWLDSFTDVPDLTRSTPQDPGFSIDFRGFSETTTLLDDLDNWVYNPSMISASSQATAACSSSTNTGVNPVGKLQEGAGSSSVNAPVHIDAVQTTAKYRRRKNQRKQVVQHVTAEHVSSDPWAWRKYGQKPIKGSPFPRSYYRCSSSKGCAARKQVERSSSEPGMFTLTYVGEHSHSHPTRRSALAGITRSSKLSASKKPTVMAASDELLDAHKSPQEIKTDHHGSSPTSTTSTEGGQCKLGRPVWGESENDDKVLQLPDGLVLGEEIFLGLDELEGLGFDFAPNYC